MRIVDLFRAAPAVTLLTAIGALTTPAVAHAVCDNYQFAANFALQQDNGVVVSMNNPDTTILDNVVAQAPGRYGDLTTGHAAGGVTGTTIDFTITWDAGNGAGSMNHYTGVVSSRSANGLIEANGLTEHVWTSQGFKCITAQPAPDVPSDPAG
jgi:hypothetical protein